MAAHPELTHPITANTAQACPSCQAQAQGNYCAHCGEATVIHPPSAGEFIHEFVGHFVALEGKLWETLRLLMFRPGQLTADFLRGRRVPTINPLRLYLSLSLVVFALIKLYGVDLPQVFITENAIGATYSHTGFVPDAPKKVGTITYDVTLKQTGGDDGQGDAYTVPWALKLFGAVNEGWAGNVRHFMHAPPAEQAELLNHGFLANLPYMLIGALPLFALYLKLIHWRSGRRYGEHLVFALHVSSFAFLLASLMILLPGNVGWLVACLYTGRFVALSAWDFLQVVPLLWLLAYLPAAMRRVYGGTPRAAWAKSLIVASVHLAVILGLVVCAELIAIVKHA